MNTSYEGKTCVITGASTGIGFGLGKKLLELGATVWMSSRTPENVEKARETLKEYGDRAHFDVVDVRFADQVTNYINGIAEVGPIDYLFNNAGVGQKGRFTEMTPEAWELIMQTNLYGIVYGCNAAIPIMLKQRYGNIINTASVCGLVPLPYQTVYAASKYAAVGLSETLRYEYADQNIKVWVVCPGGVDTMIFKRALDYSIHDEIKSPPGSISADQAAVEILDGMETYEGIIPITDMARSLYACIRKDPDKVNEVMLSLKKADDDLIE